MAKPNFILPNKPAIKAGSILSYNYTDDLKFAAEPLDFSRNSSATRVNEQGLIEEVGYFGPQLVQNGDFSQEGSELITNGDFATDSNWTKGTGTTISGGNANFVNANGVSLYQNIGTQSGFVKITFNVTDYTSGTLNVYSGGNQSVGSVNVSANALGTYTAYIDRNGGNVNIIFGSNDSFIGSINNVSVKEVGQDWDLGTGWSIGDNKAVCDGSDGVNMFQNGVIENLKKYKISFSILNYVSGFLNGRIGSANSNDFTVSSDGNYSFNITSDGTNFIFRSSSFNGSITNISVIEIIGDKPRIDYSDSSTEPSLLLEPQSTNLITYSSYFSSAIWNANTDVIVDEGYLSPEGTLNAAKVTKDGTNAKLAMFIGGTAPITKSIYARTVSGTGTAYFGEGSSSGVLSTVTEQWQRFEITVNANNFYAVDFRGAATLTEVIIFGAQFEQNSYATSYIPTSGSTVTRLGETANNAGGAGVFNSEEGVLYAEIAALANDLTNRKISISNGSSTQRILLSYSTTSNALVFQVVNSTLQVNLSYILTDIKLLTKVAVKWKLNDFSFWVNGVEVAIDSSGLTPIGLTELSFDRGFAGENFYGKVKDLQVFNHALTDEELQTLTT